MNTRYSDGTDCTDAAIKANVHIIIPNVRATALPGMDTSYKSASTQSITFTAIDPKKGDGNMFYVVWEQLASDEDDGE